VYRLVLAVGILSALFVVPRFDLLHHALGFKLYLGIDNAD